MLNIALLLEYLGCASDRPLSEVQPCPLHPDSEPTLNIVNTPDGPLFYCSACDFELDAFQLTALTLKLPEEQVLRQFAPGQPLSAVLTGSMPECHLQEYRNTRESQALIHDYTTRCHAALQGSEAGRLLVEELRSRNLLGEWIPQSLGVITHDNLPGALRDLRTCRNQLYSLYTYRAGARVTAVAVRGSTDPNDYRLIPLVGRPYGVFMDEQVPQGVQALLVAENEQLAVHLMSHIHHYTEHVPAPIVSVLDLPLPYKYRTLETVALLSPAHAPLTLETALRYCATEQFVQGSAHRPNLRVVELPAGSLTGQQIQQAFTRSRDLYLWLASSLIQLHKEQGDLAVRAVLQTAPKLPDRMAGAFRHCHASPEFLAILDETEQLDRNIVTLANGRTICRRPYGLYGNDGPGTATHIRLCDFALQFERILRDHKGRLFFRCVLTKQGEPTKVIMLPEGAFSNSASLRRAIFDQYLQDGRKVQVGVYSVPGFPWPEVRDAFAALDDAEIVQEVTHYGISPKLDVELPRLSLTRNAACVEPQTKVLDVPDAVQGVYAAVRPFQQRTDDLTACQELWQSADTGAAALAGMLSHLLFCLLQDLTYRRADMQPPARHLALIDCPPDLWLPVLRQLSYLLSGTLQPAVIEGVRDLNRMAALGSLPYPVILTDIKLDRLRSLVGGSPVNLIGTTTDVQAEQLSRRTSTTFLNPDDMSLPLPEPIDNGLLTRVRRELVTLIQRVMLTGWHWGVDAYSTVQHPAYAMYLVVCKLLDVEPAETLRRMSKDSHASYLEEIMPLFFGALRKLCYGTHPQFPPVYAFPADADDLPHTQRVFLLDDVAFVDQTVYSALNATGRDTMLWRTHMTQARIERQLLLNNFLVPRAKLKRYRDKLHLDKYWAVRRDIWDSRVAIADKQGKARLRLVS